VLGIGGVDQDFLDAAEEIAQGHFTYEYDTGNGSFNDFFRVEATVSPALSVSAVAGAHRAPSPLGHHSAAFTLAVYGHLLPRGRRGEVNCLDDATDRNPSATKPAAPVAA
jgi:hypothetical protein